MIVDKLSVALRYLFPKFIRAWFEVSSDDFEKFSYRENPSKELFIDSLLFIFLFIDFVFDEDLFREELDMN